MPTKVWVEFDLKQAKLLETMNPLKRKLQESAVATLKEEVQQKQTAQIDQLKKLNPQLKRTFIMNSWSGFCDGDEEYPVYCMALGQEYFDETILWIAKEGAKQDFQNLEEVSVWEQTEKKRLFRKILDYIKVTGSEMGAEIGDGLPCPYTDDEKDEVTRFFHEDYSNFLEYFRTAEKLAEAALKPAYDLIPREIWIEIPLK